jgi:hypothetical protein
MLKFYVCNKKKRGRNTRIEALNKVMPLFIYDALKSHKQLQDA